MRKFIAILYGVGITALVWLISDKYYLEYLIHMSAVGIGALIYLERS